MAHLTREQIVQHLTPPPGITMPPYPASRDRVYRFSLLAMTFGFLGLGIFSLTGDIRALSLLQGWIAVSSVVAAWTFLVWLRNWRFLVRTLAVLGLALWPLSSLGAFAASLSATAIMASKETHCFHFPAGKIVPWYSLGFGVILLATHQKSIHGVGWLLLAGLWGWLLWDRWKLPLFEL